MSFFIAKITEPDGDLLYPRSLYASSHAAAERLVRDAGLVEPDGKLEIKLMNEAGEAYYGRHSNDDRGIVEHLDRPWTD